MRRRGISYPEVELVKLQLLNNKSYLATIEIEEGCFRSKKKTMQVFSDVLSLPSLSPVSITTSWYDAQTGMSIDSALASSIRRVIEAELRLKAFQLAKESSS